MRSVTRNMGRIAVTQMQLRKAIAGYRSGGTPSSASATTVKSVLVASWTDDSGLYYYDLAHNEGRPVFVKAYDTFTGAIFPLREEQIIDGDLDTTRIWIDSDPGASRITLYYY